MNSHRRRNLFIGAGLATTLALGLSSCGDDDDYGTASIEGQLAAAPQSASGALRQALTSGVGIGVAQQALDSPETSLTGLSIELVEWRPDPEMREVGVVATAVPDAAGRFAIREVPTISHKPPNHGQYVVRILQEASALVPYGAGGIVRWLEQGENLELSLPIVTRLQLPLWLDPGNAAPPEQGFPHVQLGVDNVSGRLIYVTPHRGLGVYDPATGTVDQLAMASVLDMARPDTRLHVIEETGQVLLALVGSLHDAARFVLIDLDIFTEATVSEALDFDDAATATQLAGQVTVIDVTADPALPEPTKHDYYDPQFRPRSTATADGRRFYMAELYDTWIIDLESRSLAGAWHDGAVLGGYNPTAGHLYFDLPGGTLRVRDAATGTLVADRDLGAQFLLGLAPYPEQARTLVSYQAAAGVQHRMAILAADGSVETDAVAGELLGLVDRFWDPAWDWAACGPEFFRGSECPDCDERPTGIFPAGLAELHRVDMFFDGQHSRLVLPHFGMSFELRDDVLVPRPAQVCQRFGMVDECTGHPYYDTLNQAAVVQSVFDPTITCIMHVDGSDLTVPVKIEGGHSGFSVPVVLPSLGIGFVASEQALTAIHYANPDAVTQPAVRDLR